MRNISLDKTFPSKPKFSHFCPAKGFAITYSAIQKVRTLRVVLFLQKIAKMAKNENCIPRFCIVLNTPFFIRIPFIRMTRLKLPEN